MKPPKTWRGRKVYYSSRYPSVYWPGHPQAASNGILRIHRAVASEKYGRILEPKELVHHVDNNSLNWKADNLELVTSQEHAEKHPKLGQLPITCYVCSKALTRTRSQVFGRDKHFCNVKCAKAYQASGRVWPSPQQLSLLLEAKPAAIVAKALGYSTSAFEKHCRVTGVPLKPQGFWQRRRAETRAPAPIQHGKLSGYKSGCRCEQCCSWQRDQNKKRYLPGRCRNK